MSSLLAQKLYDAVLRDKIKSRSDFWRNNFDVEKIENMAQAETERIADSEERGIGLICCFDKEFPHINANIKLSDRPFCSRTRAI